MDHLLVGAGGGAPDSDQGFAGGDGLQSGDYYGGGGGGGAGGAGGGASTSPGNSQNTGGNGGVGLQGYNCWTNKH